MNDVNSVLKTIELGYIEGIHRQANRELTNKYVHDLFSMFVRKGEEVEIWSIHQWMDQLEERKKTKPESFDRQVDYAITNVEIHNSFATVVLDLYIDSKMYAKDCFSLYKFEDGWKIMTKVYEM
ncbi:MAG: nuclear transport factor 2 family protein [Candidatus Heimdallarchaeota archaeon]|nr:nuclear transport factor 2 family protein [Candidatus Heimdallarchaeota archaeon]